MCVSLRDTYGGWSGGLPYVSLRDTGCVPQGHGILFFAAWPARRVFEHDAVPLFKIIGWGVSAVRHVGEAICRGDAFAVGTKKAVSRFPDEAVVFEFGIPSDDATRGLRPQRFRGIATGPKDLAVV
jgi:hypothetical protein